MIGEKISQYRIEERIGRGGMGEVYRAWDETLQRPVAIKRIRAEVLDNELARQRFLREATSAAQLNHPAIVQIFHIVRHDEQDHIVMELVDGKNLSQDLEHGPLPWRRAASLFLEITEALEQAHGHDIVHRDLKVDNVMVTAQGHAKILDFGLAKSLRSSAVPLSAPGHVMGTLHTMSPEQARGEEVDHRTDLFSLGAMFYRVLTGTAPFRGETARETLGRVCGHHPPAVLSLRKEIPDDLSELIVELLQKDRGRRPQHARNVADRLRQILEVASGGESGEAGSVSDVPTVAARPVAMGRGRSGAVSLEASPSPNASEASSWRGLGLLPKAALLVLLVAGLAGGIAWLGSSSLVDPSSEALIGQAISVRPSVAILGLDPPQDTEDQWIATALGEMLIAELGAMGSVRIASGDDVARARRELTIEKVRGLDVDTMKRLGRLLGVDYLVTGGVESLGEESGTFLLDLEFYDLRQERLLVVHDSTGRAERLFQGVNESIEEFVGGLGAVGPSPLQVKEAKEVLPSHPDAARFYSEGLERWRILDVRDAVRLFEEAITAQPEHPMPYIALAEAWWYLGAEQKARQAADEALERVDLLPEAFRPEVVARGHAIARRWDEAVPIYARLYDQRGDDIDLGLRLAEARVKAGAVPRAAQTLDALARLPEPLGQDPRIDLARAQVHYALGELPAMLAVAERVVRQCRGLEAPLLLAQGLLRSATALHGLREPERAQKALEEARSLYAAYGDRHGAAKVLEHIAHGEWNQGNLEQAERLFEEVHQEYLKLGSLIRAASAQGYLASVLEEQGRLSEALELYDAALPVVKAAGEEHLTAAILGNQAGAFMYLGEWDRAKDGFGQAADLLSRLGDERSRVIILTNLAEIAYIQGDLETARAGHQESLADNKRLGDKVGIAYDRLRLGKVLAAQGDLHAGRDELQRAKEEWADLEDGASVAEAETDLARLALLQGRAEEAEDLARPAEQLLRNDGLAAFALLAQSVLVRSLLAQERLDEAADEADLLRQRAVDSENIFARLTALTAVARADAVAGADVAQIVLQLEELAAEAKQAGYVHAVYEARLTAGEIEMASGDAAGARARLRSLRQEAAEQGLGQIVDRADEILR